MSVTEKVPERHQVWIKKTNASERPRKCRNARRDQNRELMLTREECGGNLFTGQAVPGIEVA